MKGKTFLRGRRESTDQSFKQGKETNKQKKNQNWDEEILYFSIISSRFRDGTIWLPCQNHFSVQKASCNPNHNPQLQGNCLSASNNSRSYGDFYWTSWGVSPNTAGNLFLSSELNVFQLLGSDVIYLHHSNPGVFMYSKLSRKIEKYKSEGDFCKCLTLWWAPKILAGPTGHLNISDAWAAVHHKYPSRTQMGYWGQTELSDSMNIKCSRTEIKQSFFSKSHVSWECFGNIFLEMTKSRFYPKSNIPSNYLESPEERQVSCQTLGLSASNQPF